MTTQSKLHLCLERFEKWLEENRVTKLFQSIYYPGMGAGAVATTNFKSGDIFLEIPVELLVSTVQIQEEWSQKDFNDWPKDFTIGPLVIWLLQEKQNETSTYKPYIDMLPVNFSEFPILWTNEELTEAKGTGLRKEVQQLREKLDRMFHHFQQYLKEKFAVHWSYEEFIWAFNAMNSRWWEIVDEKGNEGFLVPGADICNHVAGGGIGCFTENQKFGLRAAYDHCIGDQVFCDYGVQSNLELLMAFGFVLEDNPQDSVSVKLPFDLINKEVLQFAEPLLQLEGNYKKATMKVSELCVELLRFFRLLHLNGERSEVETVMNNQICNNRNEILAVASAIEFLEKREKRFRTTLEEDELMLLSSLPTNRRNAIILRRAYKKIIIAQKIFLQFQIPLPKATITQLM